LIKDQDLDELSLGQLCPFTKQVPRQVANKNLYPTKKCDSPNQDYTLNLEPVSKCIVEYERMTGRNQGVDTHKKTLLYLKKGEE
jgi:hypothetical protein